MPRERVMKERRDKERRRRETYTAQGSSVL